MSKGNLHGFVADRLVEGFGIRPNRYYAIMGSEGGSGARVIRSRTLRAFAMGFRDPTSSANAMLMSA
jgi:hypothetical protein